jgi:hypothetical protein
VNALATLLIAIVLIGLVLAAVLLRRRSSDLG